MASSRRKPIPSCGLGATGSFHVCCWHLADLGQAHDVRFAAPDTYFPPANVQSLVAVVSGNGV